ncbi:MAG: glycosyltransferase family 4 protein [Betaproteobacteria bacterium]|nr:glycosyltransferase family 4 protein [Betaproteobacteria bacterium]
MSAVSGVSTHLNVLLGSQLVCRYDLSHFQVGGEGRDEGALRRLLRLVASPFGFAAFLLWQRSGIVHLNTSLVPRAYWRDFAYLCVAKLLRRKVVNQIHGGALPGAFAANTATRFLLRRFLLSSDIVAVLSSEELRAYRAFAPPARVDLVPNAIRLTDSLSGMRGVAKNGLLRLVYVGRIARAKGLFDALAALRSLRGEGLGFSFRLAGSGPDERALRDAVNALGLQDEVHLLGPVFGEKKDRLWQESDIFIFPTESEGLPYALLESMAAGCVPLTCPVGAIPDVMQDGVHGVFVPPGDPPAIAAAIRRLAADRPALSRLSQAGRDRIAGEYTVERLAARLDKIYESLGG